MGILFLWGENDERRRCDGYFRPISGFPPTVAGGGFGGQKALESNGIVERSIASRERDSPRLNGIRNLAGSCVVLDRRLIESYDNNAIV